MTRKRVALFLLMFSMSTVLAAGGGDDKKTEAGSTGGGSEKLSGTINVSGSSTVEPISSIASSIPPMAFCSSVLIDSGRSV